MVHFYNKPIKIALVLNNLSDGTGPAERITALDNEFQVDIIVLYHVDNTYNYSANKIIKLNAKSRFDLYAIINLYKLLSKNNYDIIHTHHLWSGILARLLGKLCNIKALVNSEPNEMQNYNFLTRLLRLSTLSFLDKNICVSKQIYYNFSKLENLILNKKNTVIHNAVDTNFFIPSKYTHNDTLKFITVGRLNKQKNHEIIFYALSRFKLNHNNTSFKFHIVGKGDRFSYLLQLSSKLNLDENIYFHGFIPQNNVKELLQSTNIFIMSSLYEGLSVALLQAMAVKMPVIVPNISSFQEVIDHKVNGLLYSPGNIDDLTQCIQLLSTSSTLRHNLGINARKTIEEHFSLQKTAQEYAKIYKNILKIKSVYNDKS